jgi:hypothetical protein
MKNWQKSFFSGLFLGLSAAPLALWLTEIRIKFRCPNCDSLITVEKRNGELLPELSVDVPDEDSSELPKLSIATAPTV